MRISPLNFLITFLVGYEAVQLLELREEKHMRLYQIALQIKIWHFLLIFGIMFLDIMLRVAIKDTRKLWLVESLLVVFVAGVLVLVRNIII